VEDVVRGMAHRWQQAARTLDSAARPDAAGAGAGASNFTAPECVTQVDFSRVAARIWRRPCVVPTPGWPMRLALGEQADLLLEGQRVVPARLTREGFVFHYPDLRQALESLH
jgi:NAD dependent epimerase/dehydratase family enzyme